MTVKKKIAHFGVLLGIACVLFLNYSFSNDILALLATVAACVYLLVCPQEYYIPTAIFFVAYAYLFRFGIYNIFVFVSLAVLLRAVIYHTRYTPLLVLVSGIYGFVHLFSTIVYQKQTSLGDYVPIFSILCLFAVCLTYTSSMKRDCMQHFVLGFYTTSFFGFFVNTNRLQMIMISDLLELQSVEDTLRFAGLSYDCNFYVLSVILMMYFLFFEERLLFEKERSAVWYVMLISSLLLGLITFSKSFLLAAVMLLVLALFLASKTVKKRLVRMLPITLLLFLLFSGVLLPIMDIFRLRFNQGESFSDFTTGRSDLWVLYLKNIFADVLAFLIGYGINGLTAVKAAHNVFLEIWSKFGIIGLIANAAYLFMAGKVLSEQKDFKCCKCYKNLLVVTLIFVALLFNLSAYTFYGFWIILFFILIAKQDRIPDAN